MKPSEYRPLIYRAIVTYEDLTLTGHMNITELWYLILGSMKPTVGLADLPHYSTRCNELRKNNKHKQNGPVDVFLKLCEAGYFVHVEGTSKHRAAKHDTYALTVAGQERLNGLMDYIYQMQMPYGKEDLVKKAKRRVCRQILTMNEELRQRLLKALEDNKWNVNAAVRQLGWPHRTIYRRMREFGIKRPREYQKGSGVYFMRRYSKIREGA